MWFHPIYPPLPYMFYLSPLSFIQFKLFSIKIENLIFYID